LVPYKQRRLIWETGGTAQPFTQGRKVVRPGTFASLQARASYHHEQKIISIFLDRETAKIDALIAEQQRLIELLQEKRQAVISHAVTKGAEPERTDEATREWSGWGKEVAGEHWLLLLFLSNAREAIVHL
jgi:hypothetical protein